MARALAFAFLAVVLSPLITHAQTSDVVGIRAQGMAGAFTAVADDATATWWNPAGLAAGSYFSAILESGVQRQPADRHATPGRQVTTRGISLAYPAMGLSYYRLRVSEIQPGTSTEGGIAGRQDQGAGDVRLRSLSLTQFGATVGQSLGEHFVLASTVKLLRGGMAADVRPLGASIDEAAELDVEREWHGGLDIGAMARFGGATFGVAVRNASEPTFGSGDEEFVLKRHVRAGVAFSSVPRSTGGVTVAADLDLTTAMTALGEDRRFAAGAETWLLSRSLGLRGGVSVNTIGDRRPSGSGGFSLAVRSGTYVDLEATGGADVARRGWGVGVRVTF